MRRSFLVAFATSMLLFGCDDAEEAGAAGSGGASNTGGVGGGGPGGAGGNGQGGSDGFSLSDLRFYIPVAAAAVVNTDQTYYFPMDYSSELAAAFNLCTLNVVSDAGTLVGNFQRALPRGSDDFFSFQYQFFDDGTDDFVSWGLSDQSSGERWVSVPGGRLESTCGPEGLFVNCRFIWFGEANRETSPEGGNVPATVNVDCTFLERGVVGFSCFVEGDCPTDNECVLPLCSDDGSCAPAPIREGFACDLDPGKGVCVGGGCAESPCGMPCTDDDPEAIIFCNTANRCCDTDLVRVGCQ